MGSIQNVLLVCILVGFSFHIQLVSSQPNFVLRNTETPEVPTLDEQIQNIIDQIRFLSEGRNRSFEKTSTENSIDLNQFFNILSQLSDLIPSLIESLPKNVICILSGREDCGLEAELTRSVFQGLGMPMLIRLSSLRTTTCSPLTTGEEDTSLYGMYLRMGDTMSVAADSFKEIIISTMASLPFSENLINAFSGFTDIVAKYMLELLATLLQTPMEYITLALQIKIHVPSLDKNATCVQGDLKQLIMWGIKNNVSWSLGMPLIDILLENLLPSEQSYLYPGSECQNPPSVLLQRSALETTNYTNVMFKILCDHPNFATLNETLCGDVLKETFSMSVLAFCQALSSLNGDQLVKVWSDVCLHVQELVFPIFLKSAECNVEGMQPSVFTSLNASVPLSSSSRRVIRETTSLRQLACDYVGWLESSTVDAGLVSFCSDNEHANFVKNVCNNTILMRKLLSDQRNGWLYGYCINSSADHANMVNQFCMYQLWIDQPEILVEPSLLMFCMTLDGPRLSKLICEHTGFFMLLISIPENLQFLPNCSNAPSPPTFVEPDTIQLESCRYSEWHDLTQITLDVLTKCIRFDQSGFTKDVCSNKTFLNSLLLNQDNSWLQEHCDTSFYLPPPDPQPTVSFSLASWCDYQNWGDRVVDDSIVGLCWREDLAGFEENVCCKLPVLEKLLQNPSNAWLSTVCTDSKITASPQMCRYLDWTQPIIIDMTELALCAEIDPSNFTSKVCANETILKNLLANQDNTWLVQYCKNSSKPDNSTGETGGGVSGFIPAEQCQYNSWSISSPDVTLLTLCWEHDQAKFISSICPNVGLLLFLSREPSSAWVSSMCSTYTNYTTTPSNSTTTGPVFCVADNLIKLFNWICPTYFNSNCQPCGSQNMVLQMIIRCWAENLRSKANDMLTAPVLRVLDQAVSTTMVALLVLEDAQGTATPVTETIRQNVLKSVVEYLRKENNTEKKRVLLQCFGTVLSSLLQTKREVISDELLLIKEYFNLPLSSVRPVLTAANASTVRLVLQYYTRFKDTLQLSNQYLSTMVSTLLLTHLAKDEKLFPELVPILPAANPTDIRAMPPLQNNTYIIEIINKNLGSLSISQREAFGWWYSKVMSSVTKGNQSLIKDSGNLIAYLPFQSFKHFSAAQLSEGLDILQRNTLSLQKQEFIAQTLTSNTTHLRPEDFIRLGNITCLADPEDLLVYKNTEAFWVIQNLLINCTHKGLRLPSLLVPTLLLNSSELQAPASLSVARLAELAPVLPLLGASFLQNLTSSQLLGVLPAISTVSFTPTQASIIVDKLSSSSNTLIPGQVDTLGSLIVGVKTEVLLTFTPDRLLSSIRVLTQQKQALCQQSPHKQGLGPPAANAMTTKLWGFPDVINWLKDLEPLLPCTPLLSILPRTQLLIGRLSNTSTKQWNIQQAQSIFNELRTTYPNMKKEDFLNLGTLGEGVSCTVLKKFFPANSSPSSLKDILAFLRNQPGLLHTSLKKCVIDELYQFEFFFDLLEDLGPEIALSMSVTIIKTFSVEMMNTLTKMILAEPRHFLMLSRTKQELIVDKIVQRMGMYTGVFTEAEFLSLGLMAPFVGDEVFIQVDRRFFADNLDFLRGLCYSSSKMDIVATILQEPAVFGPVKNWNQTIISQVGRFLFFLPTNILQDIPVVQMTVGRIEKLFISQRHWERGNIGMLCSDKNERKTLFEKQQYVLQFFLGFLKMNTLSTTPMVPTCEILQTTAPSVWTSSSLTSMSSSAFSNCLELMGLDPFLASYQRNEVLKRVKKMYGPVASFPQSVVSQLGNIATELSPEELSVLRLTERRSIGAMGAVTTWTSRQLAALFTTVLNTTKQTPNQLDSSTLVALGHIVCGAKTTEIKAFNNVEFSKAVLQLGQLRLLCTEEQLLALVELLTHSFAFGPMSSWGTDVFIEIGVLAAGIPDMAMSALVREQIEGITPMAISMIPPAKFTVAFNQEQIIMFSYEQAVSVTDEQLSAMTDLQKQALDMVLAPWKSKVFGVRGNSRGLALRHSPLCLTLGLLMLLTIMICHST